MPSVATALAGALSGLRDFRSSTGPAVAVRLDQLGPAVGGIGSAFDETRRFQPVDEDAEAHRRDTELTGEPRLLKRAAAGHVREHSGLCRGHREWRCLDLALEGRAASVGQGR